MSELFGISHSDCIVYSANEVKVNIPAGVLLRMVGISVEECKIRVFVYTKTNGLQLSKDSYRCRKQFVTGIPDIVFDYLKALPHELADKRLNVLSSRHLSNVLELQIDDQICFKGDEFDNFDIVKCRICYIGEVPEFGVGTVFGLEILGAGTIPTKYQFQWTPNYTRNHIKKSTIVNIAFLTENILSADDISAHQMSINTTEPITLLDEPLPVTVTNSPIKVNRNLVLSSSSQIKKEMENTLMTFNKIKEVVDAENLYYMPEHIKLVENLEALVKYVKKKISANGHICGLCEVYNANVELDCNHKFCGSCLSDIILKSSAWNTIITCPFQYKGLTCETVINQTIKNMLSIKVEITPEPVVETPETVAVLDEDESIIQCLYPDCNGKWWIDTNEENNLFMCPVCEYFNCITCKAIHSNQTCDEFQRTKFDDPKLGSIICHMCSVPISTLDYLKVIICEHIFCNKCITKLLTNNDDVIICPCDCCSVIGDDQLQAVVNPNTYREYHTRKNMKRIKSSPNGIKCQNNNCLGWFEIRQNSTEKHYECSVCRENNCIDCNMIHVKVPCHEYVMGVLQGNDEQAKSKLKNALSAEKIQLYKCIVEGKVRDIHQAKNLMLLSKKYPEISETDLIWSVKQSSKLPDIEARLSITCLLCTENYPKNHYFDMFHCDHSFCNTCAKAYFTVQIKERPHVDWVCPICKEPDLANWSDSNAVSGYFTNPFEWLETALKNILDDNVFELLTNKMRDYALSKNSNFRWCSKCENGFEIGEGRQRAECDHCGNIVCALCGVNWEKQHENVSCEKFAQWKKDNNAENQLDGVVKYLQQNGIQCPGCSTKFDLAKGGCLHFKCTQCKYEFCGGCNNPFLVGVQCKKYKNCASKGIHAHHPRNCYYYLRNSETAGILKLLTDNNVECKNVDVSNSLTCNMPIQKEVGITIFDTQCNEPVLANQAGLCAEHYKEYLIELLNNNKIDPLPILEWNECYAELERNGIAAPAYPDPEADKTVFRNQCIQLIKNNIRLY